MQITFCNTIIAQESVDGGTDAVEGFVPKRKANVQWAESLRGQDATPYARGNRKRSLTGTITPAAYDDLGTAAKALLLYLDTLPDAGGLIIRLGTTEVTFEKAVLESFDAVKRQGVTIAATLTFQVGPGKDTSSGSPSAAITDQTGADLTDQTGAPLTTS